MRDILIMAVEPDGADVESAIAGRIESRPFADVYKISLTAQASLTTHLQSFIPRSFYPIQDSYERLSGLSPILRA